MQPTRQGGVGSPYRVQCVSRSTKALALPRLIEIACDHDRIHPTLKLIQKAAELVRVVSKSLRPIANTKMKITDDANPQS